MHNAARLGFLIFLPIIRIRRMARRVQIGRITRLGQVTLVCFAVLCGLMIECLGTSPVRQFLAENRLEDALGTCRQFELLSTNDNDNLFACAWVYLRLDKSESAEKILERTKRSSLLPEYQLLQAYSKIKKKRFDEAKKILDPLTIEHKGTPIEMTAQEVTAEFYELQGQLPTAAFIYKGIIGSDPKRGRAHWGLARNYLAQGDTARAIMHLESTAKLWPKHMASRFNLGVLYLATDNIAESARWLSEAHKLNKGDPGVLEQMGLLFEKKGLIPEAVKYWQRALEINKTSTIAKEKLSVHFTAVIDNLIKNRKYSQAMAQMDNGNVTEQPALLKRRGIIHRHLGRYEKAAGDLKSYYGTVTAPDAEAARELGICYVNLKLMDQALNYFQRAANAEPDEGMNHAWLAFALESKGKLDEARESWQKALELLKDPNELEKATRRLASIEKRLGKKKEKKGSMDMGLGGMEEHRDDE